MEIDPDLISNLKLYAQRGAKFEDAKTGLMAAGYTEQEVMEASEQFPYVTMMATGGDATNQLNSVQKQAYADAMIEADVTKQREDFDEDARHAAFGVGHTSTQEHRDRFVTWDLAIRWWIFYPGLILWAVVALWLHLPKWIYFGVIILLVVLRIWHSYPRYSGRQ